MDALAGPSRSTLRPGEGKAGWHASPEGWRRSLLEEIARSFERFAGFQITEGVMKKLVLHFASIPDGQLSHAIQKLKGLPYHHPDWQVLLDLLTVHETYFYRDAAQLDHVRRAVIPGLIDHAVCQRTYRLRFWSAGCSSGEEAFMLAFLVLEELMRRGQAHWTPEGEVFVHPAWNIEILGSDISEKVLHQARSGRYRCNHSMSSFREMPQSLRSFFIFPPPSFTRSSILDAIVFAQVKSSVQSLTRFVQQNLAVGAALAGVYDLVFCRNVMIYFQDDIRLKVQQMLHRSLRIGGFLVLGPPDVLMLPGSFRRIQGPLAVCYEKIPELFSQQSPLPLNMSQ